MCLSYGRCYLRVLSSIFSFPPRLISPTHSLSPSSCVASCLSAPRGGEIWLLLRGQREERTRSFFCLLGSSSSPRSRCSAPPAAAGSYQEERKESGERQGERGGREPEVGRRANMTATSVSGNPSNQQLVSRRAFNGETCSFWRGAMGTRGKLARRSVAKWNQVIVHPHAACGWLVKSLAYERSVKGPLGRRIFPGAICAYERGTGTGTGEGTLS